MREFQPDYRHVENAARNREASRLPLYEHLVDFGKIGEFYHRNFDGWYDGSEKDMEEYFHYYCRFFKDNGYDIVPFESQEGTFPDACIATN